MKEIKIINQKFADLPSPPKIKPEEVKFFEIEQPLAELCNTPKRLDSTLYFIRNCKGEELHPFCDYFHVDKSGDDATIKEQLIEKVKQFAIESLSVQNSEQKITIE